jgi:predicted nuclease of predicted toxin-antitoxin system
MKLLFDHNLSYKLVGRLADQFPDSEHVRNVNLHEANDRTVWEYARTNGFAIVSKDEDFHPWLDATELNRVDRHTVSLNRMRNSRGRLEVVENSSEILKRNYVS